MEKTLKVINRMKADGVIDDYAIGGAVAAIFYVEPFDTFDLDIFFAVKSPPHELAVLAPLYEYLATRGYTEDREYVQVEGWPVQFLPIYSPLIAEAVQAAMEIKFKRTPTRVMRAEHLAAIMLETGRPKDYARLSQFLEAGVLDAVALADVLARYGLSKKWQAFLRKYRP